MSRMTDKTRYSRYKQYNKNIISHIYNHGNFKQEIFLESNDYRFYLNKLIKAIKQYNASLISYALMPNHIHLVLRQNNETPIHKVISSLHTSYSIYFNKKNNRIGHLFQDRFKQVIVETDEQLIQLSRYIHLNPVKAGLVEKPWKYPWSSYQEVIGANPLAICDKDIIIRSMISLTGIEKADFTKSYSEFCLTEPNESDKALLDQVTLETF